jgi:hypothetical protein
MLSTATPAVTNPCPCCLEEGHEIQLHRVTENPEGYGVVPFFYCERCEYMTDEDSGQPEVDEHK